MAAIDDEDIIECNKNEADHIWEEETNFTSYDNSDVKSEVDDKTIDYNTKDESYLKETVKNVNNIGIKNESFESVNNIEIPEEDDGDVIEYKNETDHIWEEDKNFTSCYTSEINVKSEVDDKPLDYNIKDEANLKETIDKVSNIRIKQETLENINNTKLSEESVKNDNGIEVTEKTIKNSKNIEFLYNLPGDSADELHSETPGPQGGPHCARSALSFASQEAFDDHKMWSAERADERTAKIIPRFTEPVVFNGVQFAKSLRVVLWKYNAPPEYAGVFGAPYKKSKADSLKEKNSSKTSTENSVKTVNADANIPELFNETEQETKNEPNYTGTVVGDKNNSLSESSNDKFICNECGHQCHENSIILHIKTKHVKDVHTRNKKCAYSTVTKDGLEKHLKLHADNKQYFCDVCTNRFTSKITMKRHKQCCDVKDNVSNTSSTIKPYSCAECSKKFSNRYNFNIHMSIHTGEKPYSCKVCKKKFCQSAHLSSHMRTHTGEKPYSCKVCKKKLCQSAHLSSHMRTHTGEKPYSCTVCNKHFSFIQNLNIHMRIHTGEKPYLCAVCRKQFNQSNNFNRHMRTHTGEKPYSCTMCKKNFSSSSDLKSHMRIHTGEKPYSCTVCNKYFSHRISLNRHNRIHTGEKPYSCTVCNKHFRLSNDLKLHLRIHTGEKPYSCTVCKKIFSQSNSLNRHIITHIQHLKV